MQDGIVVRCVASLVSYKMYVLIQIFTTRVDNSVLIVKCYPINPRSASLNLKFECIKVKSYRVRNNIMNNREVNSC